jgi:hypothetical protein
MKKDHKATHCKRGHARTPENLYKGGGCKLCHKIVMDALYALNKEEINRKNREYAAEHKEESSLRHKVWYQNLTEEEKQNRYNIKQEKRLSTSGWSLQSVEKARAEQNNRCAICGDEFLSTPHADHEHVTPPIPRGLLCYNCNGALGMFRDSPEILRIAAGYVEKYKTQNQTQEKGIDSYE